MSLCPYCSKEMTHLKESNGAYWEECPRCKHRFLALGVGPLIPLPPGEIVQRSIIEDISPEELQFIKSLPDPGEQQIISIERSADGKLKVDYKE